MSEEHYRAFRDDRPRHHHYQFAHRALPRIALKRGTRMLEMARDGRLLAALEETWNVIGGNLQAEHRLMIGGLAASVHEIDGFDIVLIRMPEAKHVAEAFFAAVCVPAGQTKEATAPTRYFVLEFGWTTEDERRTVFCEWSQEGHVNMGDGPVPEEEAFLAAIKRVLTTPGAWPPWASVAADIG